MPADSFEILRDGIVLSYMLFLRVALPLLCIVLLGKWIQSKMAEADRREQLAHQGEPYCWDLENTVQAQRAYAAAAAHPELPCWLAVQRQGGGVTEQCYHCARYAVQTNPVLNAQAEEKR